MGIDPVTDLAIDVAVDLAGGTDWRLALPGIDTGDYWKWGLGEDIVSSNLDGWTGQVNGGLMSAPSAGQRPTPDTNGWAYVTANTTSLLGAATLAAQLDGTDAYTVYVYASRHTSTFATFWSAANAASGTQYHSLQHTSATLSRYQRRNGTASNAEGSSAWGTTGHVLSAVHGGTNSECFFDGTGIAGPSALAQDPSGFTRVGFGALADLTPSNYLTGTISEVIVCMAAHDDATVATVSANLAAEYAP